MKIDVRGWSAHVRNSVRRIGLGIARGRRAQLLVALLMGVVLGGGLVGLVGDFGHHDGRDSGLYQTEQPGQHNGPGDR